MEQRITDRTNWNRGPWDNEPDRVDFITNGYAAFTLRGPMGSWCGYVGVPETHPAFGKDYSSIELELDVHGGITYAEKCQGAICHIPAPGMPDEVWWLGFDTAHYMDLSPKDNYVSPDATYRDIGYIIAECIRLAKQLKKMELNANA